MSTESSIDAKNLEIAQRWCQQKGLGWSLVAEAGRGGTAPVYSIQSPDGARALKIYDAQYSGGDAGRIEEKRVQQQRALGIHDCPYLIRIYDGGQFEGRLFLLMNLAPGRELRTRLSVIPRNKIRKIVGQIAEAAIFLRNKGLCHRDIKSANIFVSDDFEHATLLDVSVSRAIYDPVGVGTDHGDQLPVVATARYCPPEYLFRILDADTILWHALDIYQLGGLLHDLIMRVPLFEAEYSRSKENRYRFAWTVATVNPAVEAADVDQDLVFLARRALDKNWERRSQLTLEDFKEGAENRQNRALASIGIARQAGHRSGSAGTAALLQRVREIAEFLEASIDERLRAQGALARHFVKPGDSDLSKRIGFVWNAGDAGQSDIVGEVTFDLALALVQKSDGQIFRCTSELTATIQGKPRVVSLRLPDVEDSAQAGGRLLEQMGAVLGALAVDLLASKPIQ